jgi:sarcosine oxidase, subunit gamma
MGAAETPPLRRSFVHAKLVAAGARSAPVRGGLVALDHGDPAAERAALASLALIDLSPLPRVGFKGRGTPEWLAGEGVRLPEPNLALRQNDGTLVARLAPREALLLPPLTGGEADPTARLEPAWREARRNRPGEPLGYPVPRADSHAWFLVTGERAPAMFAKICGVDLRQDRFAPLRVAQTQAMRLSVVVIRDDAGLPAWHLLLDSASAEYAWDCLLDAMAEFGGRPAGLAALG